MSELLTIQEVAMLLKVSRQHVRKMILPDCSRL